LTSLQPKGCVYTFFMDLSVSSFVSHSSLTVNSVDLMVAHVMLATFAYANGLYYS